MNSLIVQGCRMGSAVTPGFMGPQVVLHNQMVPLAEVCVYTGPTVYALKLSGACSSS